MYDEKIELLIDGRWLSSPDTEALVNPATEEQIATIPCATEAQLDEALEASACAFKKWKVVPPTQRAAVLHQAAQLIEQRKESIARTLTMENGKILAEALGEVQFAADAVHWYAEEGKRAYGRVIPSQRTGVRQLTLKEPVGPALGFAAWNFPATNVTLKIAGALAAGCSIIVKPSNETPGTAVAIARCFQDAGLVAGALNIVLGPPAQISKRLIASRIPKQVSLTGSTPVGKLLQRQAADTLKRCTMELGGHAPAIVFSDADLPKTIAALVASKFRNAGQVCTSPTRFYVQQDVYEQFVHLFTQETSRLVLGNGLDSGTQMGPLITATRQNIMDRIIVDAQAHGATVTTGGTRNEGKGYFYNPTVLRDVSDSADIMINEPFGPLVPITPFGEFDEVIARANSLPFGLASYVFTTSGKNAMRASEALEAGLVGINNTSVHEVETPFGGINESGYGHESGPEGLEAYLRTKFIAEAQY